MPILKNEYRFLKSIRDTGEIIIFHPTILYSVCQRQAIYKVNSEPLCLRQIKREKEVKHVDNCTQGYHSYQPEIIGYVGDDTRNNIK